MLHLILPGVGLTLGGVMLLSNVDLRDAAESFLIGGPVVVFLGVLLWRRATELDEEEATDP